MNIDLNCDMGEGFGAYTLGMDAEIISSISSANIACGFHAGDPIVMNRTVKMAVDLGVAIGAHPGFPDLMGFGRRNMDCSTNEIKDYLIYQIGALQAFCVAHGVRLRHVKPHGALYGTGVDLAVNGKVRRMAALVTNQKRPGIDAVVPSYCTLSVHYNPLKIGCSELKDVLWALENELEMADIPEPRLVEIPVCYGEAFGQDIRFCSAAQWHQRG